MNKPLFWSCSSVLLSALLAGYALPGQAAEGDDEVQFIEEIIVTGERGAINTLDRAMTVTGFNESMISQLGIQNTNDLEVLVPGMQIGPRSQGGGKNEDGHIVMRGVANDRSVNFFQDVGVAVYIDGVYSDQSYGLDQGAMFDVERVEIARGPQGTTGGKAAIAGAVNFVTKKPTDEFDIKAAVEVTDQSSQQVNLAFGGPIGDSPFSYRLGVSRLTGDGLIENVGSGPDAGEPDQLIYSPQLRFKTDRWDVTARYSKLEDEGTPRVSLILGARNSVDEFLSTPVLDPFGDPVTDANGDIVFQRNPFFGIGQNPAVRGCSGFNDDGTRSPGTRVVCDGDDLEMKIDVNAPILQDNSQESYTLEAHYQLTDSYEIVYKFGHRDTRQQSRNDLDGTNRQGGGVCPPDHPLVLSGELTAGQVHSRCALDGGGNGSYADQVNDYLFTSDQDSHEITLISNLDGPFNFTVGYTLIDGEEPYVYQELFNGLETGNNPMNNAAFYTDTSEECEAALPIFFGGEDNLWRNIRNPDQPANQNAAGLVWGCHGSPYAVNWSDVSNGLSHVAGGPAHSFFYGNVSYKSEGYYANAEYVLNDQWTVFGGVRYNDDHKEHDQNDFSGVTQFNGLNGTPVNWAFGIFRSKHYAAQCCGYVGSQVDASGNPIPDNRTLMDSKIVDWDEVTWNAGFQYSPNDSSNVYGRISKGYRPGGFAGFGAQLGEAFDPEEMINYEIGYKGLFFGGTVQLEASAYFQDFDSYWVQSGRLRTPAEIRPGESIFTGETVSVDGTEIYGVEFQYQWMINERLRLSGFYEYMGSSLGSYTSVYCCTPDGSRPPASTVDVVDDEGNTVTVNLANFSGPIYILDFGGNSLRNQPEHKLSAALSYNVPLPADYGNLDLTTIVNWRDIMYVDEANLDIYSVPEYTRWDLRARWTSVEGNWTVTAWATNLLDEIAVQSYAPREGNGVDGPIAGTVTDERRFGLTVDYQL